MSNNNSQFNLSRIRHQFPALRRSDGVVQAAVFSDAPGGTQMPMDVIEAMSGYLHKGTANLGGVFSTSLETAELVKQARSITGQFLNAPQNCIVFGANMTSLTFSFSRAISRTWQAGEEIIVSMLDHDANITPWVLAAEERGCTVHKMTVTDEVNLSVSELQRLLSEKTCLVAFTLASNVTGSITPARELIQAAHDAGVKVFVDAVHYAAHHLIDVSELDTDFLVCSPYKFCGPHLGVLYGKSELLESIEPYKVRASINHPPGSWENGTQNFEAIAGLIACIRYHGWLTDSKPDRAGLENSAHWISQHEEHISEQFLKGCRDIDGVTLYGSPETLNRTPTFALTKAGRSSAQLAELLAERGVYAWSGHCYALDLIRHLRLESFDGVLRIGFVHYHTEDEVFRVLNALEDI